MKNNKLIAEFMGLSIKEGVCYYTDSNDMFPMGIEVEEPYLPFNTSWDWLMPVAEKCLTSDEKTDGQHYFINDALLTCNIDVVYDRVVDFIKNQNK